MVRCINCGTYCDSKYAGVITEYNWYCAACYDVVSDSLTRLELEKILLQESEESV